MCVCVSVRACVCVCVCVCVRERESNHGRLYGVSADHHPTGPEERHGEDVQQDDRQTAAGEGAGGTLSYCQHRSWGRGVGGILSSSFAFSDKLILWCCLQCISAT